MERRGQVDLSAAVGALRKQYGPPEPAPVRDAWGLILYENCAYLVDDQRRQEVWRSLCEGLGTRGRAPTARQILDSHEVKIASLIERGGMQPLGRARKLIEAARIVTDEFGGKPDRLLDGDLDKARRALKKFPGIGEPGADKILLFTRTQPVLAVDSNGLRVLVRLGFGEEGADYGRTYRSVQEAITPTIPAGFDGLVAAHLLLRVHGQEMCTRKGPACEKCPLAKLGCPSVGTPGEVV